MKISERIVIFIDRVPFFTPIVFVILITLFYCSTGLAQMGDSQLKRAQIYVQSGNYEQARKILEAIVEKGEANTDAYYLMGLTYRGLKQLEKAESAFKMVLNRDPRSEIAHIQLAAVQMDMSKPIEAEKTLSQLLRLNPKSPQGHYAAGVIFYKGKDILKAIREFKEAILCDKKYAPAYGNLGIAYYNRNQLSDALQNFDLAANFAPMEPRYLFYAGWTARAMDKKDKATSYFRRASNLKAPSVYSVTWKIIQAYDAKDFAKAREAVNEVFKIDPEFDKGLYFQGLLFIEEKKYKEAADVFKKMLEQDPLDRDALEQMTKLKPLLEQSDVNKTTPKTNGEH